MDGVLDGVMPMVIGCCLYAVVMHKPITIPVVIVMGAVTICYHAIKHYISKSRQEKS